MNAKMTNDCRNDVRINWNKARVIDTARRSSEAKKNVSWVNWSHVARVQGSAAMHMAVEHGWVEKSNMCF